MLRLLPLASLCLLAALAPAVSSDSRRNLTGEELRRLVSGHTVTGRHDTGMPYSEWHAPSGQVYGHNNREPNDKACWDIKGDAVCYYYSGGVSRGTFCWTFQRVAENGYRLQSEETNVMATGIWQAGNPHDFSDNDKPWSCEPLSSRNNTPRPAPATRQASR
jgi:hypothetical protein